MTYVSDRDKYANELKIIGDNDPRKVKAICERKIANGCRGGTSYGNAVEITLDWAILRIKQEHIARDEKKRAKQMRDTQRTKILNRIADLENELEDLGE